MSRRLTTEEFIEKATAVHGNRYDYSQVEYVDSVTDVTIICRDHGPFQKRPGNHTANKQGCPDCGSKKYTTEMFIEKATAVHGDRYDYSQVEYVDSITPVTIICRDHGPFPQQPASHLRGNGCADCSGHKQLTTETFIEKATVVHDNRYDYSQVEYVDSATKVAIICPDHGLFEVTPNNHHSKKSGCPDCASTKLTTELFIEKAIAVHGDRYDYSQVEYVNKRMPVTIICPDHGPFQQLSYSHYSKSGCAECAGVKKLTKEMFIERAKAIHGNRYDYTSVDCVSYESQVMIICLDHGPFSQQGGNHLSGRGCPECAGVKRLTTDSFIHKAKAVHGDCYDYSSVDYVVNRKDVTIICRDHGPFPQIAANHLNGSGCPDCAEPGFNPSEPGVLYYVAVTTDDGDRRYKIGITNRTVEERFRGADLARICIVRIWQYAVGRFAAEREAEILRQHEGDKYYGPDVLQTGNSELFTHDILELDQ